MRNRIALALALSVLFVLAGCGKGSKLVGTWTTTADGIPAEMTFNADGTALIQVTIQQAPMTGTILKMPGTYKDQGDKLALTIKDVTVENLPATLKGHEAEVVAGAKKQMGSEIGKENVASIKWTSDTTFTSTDEKGKTTTFTKKA